MEWQPRPPALLHPHPWLLAPQQGHVPGTRHRAAQGRRTGRGRSRVLGSGKVWPDADPSREGRRGCRGTVHYWWALQGQQPRWPRVPRALPEPLASAGIIMAAALAGPPGLCGALGHLPAELPLAREGKAPRP